MKNHLKFSYIAVTILSIVIFLVLLLNIFLMYRLTSKQTDEMGQMKIDLIALPHQEEHAFTEDMCFTVSKVLGDGESILGIDYSMSEIQAYIEKMNASDYGEAMIINRDGVIVGFSDTKIIGQRLLPFANFLKQLAA